MAGFEAKTSKFDKRKGFLFVSLSAKQRLLL